MTAVNPQRLPPHDGPTFPPPQPGYPPPPGKEPAPTPHATPTSEPYLSAFTALAAANAAKLDQMQSATQRMNAGLSFGLRRSSAPGYVFGVPPAALDVAVTGTPAVGFTVTGHYVYFDANGDPEGTSLFAWLRDGVPIAGATAKTYAIVAADGGHTLAFRVTPVSSVAPTNGTPVTTAPGMIPAP